MPSSNLYHKENKTSNRRAWYILFAVCFIMLIVLLYSKIFSRDGFYERAFYEKISGIHIPKFSKHLESFDNGEFWTAASFRISNDSLFEFIRTFNFKLDSSIYKPKMFSETSFKLERLESFSNKYVYNYGTKGKNSWIYIIDPDRSILWAEIQYPDWGGD